MDAVVRESLASLAKQDGNQRVKDTLLNLAPKIQNAPSGLSKLIGGWDPSDIGSLVDWVAHASETDDWSRHLS